jgi:hypothetical protein
VIRGEGEGWATPVFGVMAGVLGKKKYSLGNRVIIGFVCE